MLKVILSSDVLGQGPTWHMEIHPFAIERPDQHQDVMTAFDRTFGNQERLTPK